MFLLLAILLGVIGASIIFLHTDIDGKDKTVAFVILTIVYSLLGWLILYSGLPSLAWPLFGVYGLLLFFWLVISSVVGGSMSSNGWQHAWWLPIIYVFAVIITLVSGSEMFRSSDYVALIGNVEDKTEKHWSQDIQPLDPTHIRLVPEELAFSLAKTTLSQNGATLGSQFPLDSGHLTLQKINNDYWYLIPLDFKSWKVWTNADYIPAYVKVSATDPYAKPQLITGKKFKYTPNAYFGDNLERRLYSQYKDKVLRDYSFEEDDNGNVFWVITVCKPTITYWGLVVEGVIIFNPETGENEYVAKSEVVKNTKYAWIDRVMPEEIIESYINSWGDLKDGWWNSFWDHVNLLQSETPTMNYSVTGQCVFVAPITSSSRSDQAMTGLMYADARSGKFIYYTTSGGATEEAVITAVNDAVKFQHWHSSSEIIYENVYGKLSALIPVLGDNGNYQGLAIVENENKRLATGSTPQEALSEYQRVLMSAGGQITTDNSKDVKEYTGKIIRLGWEISGKGKQYFICVAGSNNSFVLSSTLQSELSLTREGDVVYIQYIQSEQSVVPVNKFKNITLNLKGSKNEKSVNAQMSKRTEEVKTKADVKDFKESINEMPDEQVKQLMEKQKK